MCYEHLLLSALCHNTIRKPYFISDRQWLYQSCTEFGYFQTSNRENHLFGNTIPLEYYTDLCTDVFGKS